MMYLLLVVQNILCADQGSAADIRNTTQAVDNSQELDNQTAINEEKRNFFEIISDVFLSFFGTKENVDVNESKQNSKACDGCICKGKGFNCDESVASDCNKTQRDRKGSNQNPNPSLEDVGYIDSFEEHQRDGNSEHHTVVKNSYISNNTNLNMGISYN